MTCNLGCTETCKARDHGCASECPALPWQPERERDSVGTGLLAQIAACKREVASWPDWMRTMAVLRMHPAAMDGRD